MAMAVCVLMVGLLTSTITMSKKIIPGSKKNTPTRAKAAVVRGEMGYVHESVKWKHHTKHSPCNHQTWQLVKYLITDAGLQVLLENKTSVVVSHKSVSRVARAAGMSSEQICEVTSTFSMQQLQDHINSTIGDLQKQRHAGTKRKMLKQSQKVKAAGPTSPRRSASRNGRAQGETRLMVIRTWRAEPRKQLMNACRWRRKTWHARRTEQVQRQTRSAYATRSTGIAQCKVRAGYPTPKRMVPMRGCMGTQTAAKIKCTNCLAGLVKIRTRQTPKVRWKNFAGNEAGPKQ